MALANAHRAALAVLAVALIAVGCGGGEPQERTVVDVGADERVADPFTGEAPELDGLTPAVSTAGRSFPLILEQCVVDRDALQAEQLSYTATRVWVTDPAVVDYSDVLELVLDLEAVEVDEDGCFTIPVLNADIPPEIVDAVDAYGEPVEVSVTINLVFDVDGAENAVQRFEPFWLVP